MDNSSSSRLSRVLAYLCLGKKKPEDATPYRGPLDHEARWGTTVPSLIDLFEVEAVVVNPGNHALRKGQVLLCRRLEKGEPGERIMTNRCHVIEVYPHEYAFDLELTTFDFVHRYQVKAEDVMVVAESRLIKRRRKSQEQAKRMERDQGFIRIDTTAERKGGEHE